MLTGLNFYHLLTNKGTEHPEVVTTDMDEAFLDKATKVVIDNIGNIDFSLKDLREKLGVSQSVCYHKMKALTGQNPSIFFRTVRLKYAADLLVKDGLSIKEVSYKSGFSSPAYFNKTFKELFGQTPKEYLEQYLTKHETCKHS